MYLYNLNYPSYEEELCKLEIRYLFNEEIIVKTFIHQNYIDVDRSPFIKYSIAIYVIAETFEDLLEKVSERKYKFNNYKVKFAGEKEGIDFKKTHELEGEIAYVIDGRVDVHDPEIVLAISIFEGKWIFGKFHKNNGLWRRHEWKPYSYSNALNTRMARALVNLAAADKLDSRVVDPCCGIGTVVMEGCSMGVNISGFDINLKVVERARKNLKFFEYEDVIALGDVHTLQGDYDAAIIDLPYGISSSTDAEERKSIIKSASGLANKIIIVCLEEIDKYIETLGFIVVDRCVVSKMNFKRHIYVCEKNSY
jgi:tRNA (guanine10-N2)-dimethyltransferase